MNGRNFEPATIMTHSESDYGAACRTHYTKDQVVTAVVPNLACNKWQGYLDLVPHNNAGPLGTAATLHAALAIRNVTMIEAPWVNGDIKPDVVYPYPKVEQGYALPLDGPGLGINFDEALARSRPFRKPGLQPRLNAPDGSVRDF